MNGTASAAVSVLTRPFARIPEAQRKRICLILLTAAALAFPILHPNDADVDSMANAAAYATLALGLNIVVGFAGLLDLGYAAFFAIGAYTYGILTAFQLQPEWSAFWEPFHYLGLVAPMPGETGTAASCTSPCRSGSDCHWRRGWRRSSASCSARRHCGCAATTSPSSPWASARSCRSWCATGRT